MFAVVVGTSDTDWNAHALVAAAASQSRRRALDLLRHPRHVVVRTGLLVGQIIRTHGRCSPATAAGAGVELAIRAAGGSLSEGARWALCGGVAGVGQFWR